MSKSAKLTLIPVMLCFFAMGFVDMVGIASNYVKEDLNLNDATANMFPSLVFFWFLLFSVPTGMLMNKIGKKNTVLLSLAVTTVSLLLPLFGENFTLMLVSFSLLGIGNTLMQTSLNPLVSVVIKGNLASTLTFGQFVKAIASFLAPYIAMWGAMATIPSFGFGWRILFPIYMIIGMVAAAALCVTSIPEEHNEGKATGIMDSVRLLGRPIVLLSFIGIMCHVGIDVGTNTTAPKILIERLGWSLNEAAFATFIISVVMMALSMAGMFVGTSKVILYAAIALVGYGNSNIFSIVFSQALISVPEHKNEVSGLMIMGLFGGTVFPLLMGFASDAIGQVGAVAVMAAGVVYLFTYINKVKQ